MTSAENQLYRFNYCLALVLVTIFFELVFTEHWRRSFWLSFLIICRWNLFRTICANSRKVGLGKFLSPYKGIPVDLSRPEPHPHFFMFAHWSVMQERSIINACRFYSLQWLLHMYVCLTVSLWLYTFQIPYYGLLATTARGCEFLAGSCGRFFGYTIILFLLFYH